MTTKLKPNVSGYICNWLISGNFLSTPEINFSDRNQLKFEKQLRSVIADDSLEAPPAGIELGGEGLAGMPWKYYSAGNNWFIDTSLFYSLLTKVELYAYTELICERDMKVAAKLRTFAAVDLWLNDRHVAKVKTPVYKPIHNEDVQLPLKKGKNKVFLRMQNLGVRDTRNIMGLQLLGDLDGITVSLPGAQNTVEAVIAADQWLKGIVCKGDKLNAESEPPCAVTVKLKATAAVYEKAEPGIGETDLLWRMGTEYEINSKAQGIILSAEVSGQYLEREIELAENIRPEMDGEPAVSLEAHRKKFIGKLAEGWPDFFKTGIRYSGYHVLARYMTGRNEEKDNELLMEGLDLVYKRIDCADFLLSALLRLFLKYEVKSEKVRNRMKEVCLDFRYWMDEEGSDGMCFWSENHALLFHGCQMLAGQLYPDEIFTRSGRTGKEQSQVGEKRCREWLASVEHEGFEEFISGGYMCVTAAGLLNLVDFGPEDISGQAIRVLDKLLAQLSMHTFKGVVCGPQGRVYRDVIYPFKQGVQALMYLINPAVPKAYSMWAAGFGCTKYEILAEIVKLMETETETVYPCGNAEITLKKTADYLLTSVASPKAGNGGWSNEAYEHSDPHVTGDFTYAYTKALNERFHGTSLFEPGVYGYQQHMWYAALDRTCPVFANHPGGTHDHSSMRPGYWYGNGLMPALKQKGNMLGLIYHLREEHPVNFTHLFWPSLEFDSIVKKKGWLFGKKGSSYVGVWCSAPLEPHNDILMDCEYRAYSEKAAYICYCSSEGEVGTFDAFIEKAEGMSPEFQPESLILTTTEGYELRFVEKHNYSQYI